MKYTDILKQYGVAYTTEEFNSNNGWGFGGAYGRRYRFSLNGKDYDLTEGTACYRHLPSQSYVALRERDIDVWFKIIFDVSPRKAKHKLDAFLRDQTL